MIPDLVQHRAAAVSRPAGGWRGLLRRVAAGRDLGLAYALVVVVLAVVLGLLPDHVHERLVLDCSTNLANLRDRPLLVLVASAFVLDSTVSLWLVVLVVGVYGAVQRWLGRTATVLVAAAGHVFATLFVAVLLASGIAHHQLSRSIAREPDVGVSYGLAALMGLLTWQMTGRLRRWRLHVQLGGIGWLGLLVVLQRDFTDLGHLVSWCTGLTLGLVGAAMARAAVAAHDRAASAPAP